MLQNLKNKQKEQLVFSSDDSLNSNNSFASSVDEDEKEDFSNHFLNLKDQMEHFLSQNPDLEENLKFQPFKEPNSDDEEQESHPKAQGNDAQNQGYGHQQAKKPQKNLYKGPKIEHRDLKEADKKRSNYNYNQDSNSDEDKKKAVTFDSATVNKDKSKLWKTVTKDIVRMGQFGCKTPTLETVNHRLNIFKAKIDKIDYLDYLQKEMTQTAGGLLTQQQNGQTTSAGQSNSNNQNGTASKEGNGGQSNLQKESNDGNANQNANQQEDDSDVGRDKDGNLLYFSFKKKMHNHLQKKIEKTKKVREEEEVIRQNEAKYKTTSGGRRANMVSRGILDAKKLIIEQELQDKKRKANEISKEKIKRKSFTGLKGEESPKEEAIIGIDKDSNLNFQTRIGIALYQTYQQCAGDKESFKKTANFILKDYNKTKAQFYKKKPFPPQTTKFTNEETKALNVFLPDFNSNLYAPNKNNLFANIDAFELQPGTPEGDFVAVVDKILDGALLRFWKESQNQQN